MSEQQAKPRVLVADDERVIADTLAIILNQAGFDATAVYSGEKAVEMAQILRPDMLISDVIMTDLNGIDAAIQIRAMLPDCKILLFSRPGRHRRSPRPGARPGPRVRNPRQARPPSGSARPPAQLGSDLSGLRPSPPASMFCAKRAAWTASPSAADTM